MAETYREKLRRREWIDRRSEIIQMADYACQFCDSPHNLQVHHRVYFRGREPWEYSNAALMCICDTCHEQITYRTDDLLLLVAALNDVEVERLIINAKRMLKDRLGHEDAEYLLSDLKAKT